MIPAINSIKGVVFDLRGYPTAEMDYLMVYLINIKDTAFHWLLAPLIKMPDFTLIDYKTAIILVNHFLEYLYE